MEEGRRLEDEYVGIFARESVSTFRGVSDSRVNKTESPDDGQSFPRLIKSLLSRFKARNLFSLRVWAWYLFRRHLLA